MEKLLERVKNCEDKKGLYEQCLRIYYVSNYTGPEISVDKYDVVVNLFEGLNMGRVEDEARTRMIYECENVRKVVQNVVLFYIADHIHNFYATDVNSSDGLFLLLLRSQMYNCSFSSMCAKAEQAIRELFDHLKQQQQQQQQQKEPFLLLLSCCLKFYQYQLFDEVRNHLFENFMIEMGFTGVLGKRMMHQTNSLPQLVCTLQMRHNEKQLNRNNLFEMPRKEEFDGSIDGAMEHVQFDHYLVETTKTSLSNFQFTLVLLIIEYQYRVYPKDDEMNLNQIKSMLEFLSINLNPKNICYICSYCFLYWRSFVDFTASFKRIDRSLRQFESLIHSFKDYFGSDKFSRLNNNYFLIGLLLPIYEIKENFAEQLMNLGCVKTCLDFYLELENYEKAVQCYLLLGLFESAETLLDRQLKTLNGTDNKKTVCERIELLRIMGDLKKDFNCLKKAWLLSEKKSFKVKKTMGIMHYKGKNYRKALKDMKKSLKLNSNQQELWFIYGCLSIKMCDVVSAAEAFLYCVRLEPDNFEAWNNLASVYTQKSRFDLAHNVLKNTLKFKYNSWRMVSNFLVISLKIESYQDALFCCKRLIELYRMGSGEKSLIIGSISDDILMEFVSVYSAVRDGKKSLSNYSFEKFQTDLHEMFEALVGTKTVSWLVYRIYADCCEGEKRASVLVLCYRELVINNNSWERDIKLHRQIVSICEDMISSAEEKMKEDMYMLVGDLIKRCSNVRASLMDEAAIGESLARLVDNLGRHQKNKL